MSLPAARSQILMVWSSLPLARSLAIAGDRIVGGVGAHEPALPGPERVDLGGRCVVPGFTDSHVHFATWAIAQDEVRLEGRVRFGPWRLESARPGLSVRTRRPGDRLAGRTRKIQDVFVDAKVPRSDREAWPLVVRGDEVVAVPGIVDHPEVEAVRD